MYPESNPSPYCCFSIPPSTSSFFSSWKDAVGIVCSGLGPRVASKKLIEEGKKELDSACRKLGYNPSIFETIWRLFPLVPPQPGDIGIAPADTWLKQHKERSISLIMDRNDVTITKSKVNGQVNSYEQFLLSADESDLYSPFVTTHNSLSWNVLSLFAHRTIRFLPEETQADGVVEKRLRWFPWFHCQPAVNVRTVSTDSIALLEEKLFRVNEWRHVCNSGVFVAPYRLTKDKNSLPLGFMLSGSTNGNRATREKLKVGAKGVRAEDLITLICFLSGFRKDDDDSVRVTAYLRNQLVFVVGASPPASGMTPVDSEAGVSPVLGGNAMSSEVSESLQDLPKNSSLSSSSEANAESLAYLWNLCLDLLKDKKLFNELSSKEDWARLYTLLVDYSVANKNREAFRRYCHAGDSRILRLQTIALFQVVTRIRLPYVEGQKRLGAVVCALNALDVHKIAIDAANSDRMVYRQSLSEEGLSQLDASLAVHVSVTSLFADHPNSPAQLTDGVAKHLRKLSARLTNELEKAEKRSWYQILDSMVEDAITKQELFVRWKFEKCKWSTDDEVSLYSGLNGVESWFST